MIALLKVIYMAAMARASGGGLGAKYLDKKGKGSGRMPFNLTWLPEALFAAGFGVFGGSVAYKLVAWLTLPYTLHDFNLVLGGLAAIYVGIRVAIWSYGWMQTGIGFVLYWGRRVNSYDIGRRHTLSPAVDWLADRLGIEKMLDDGVSPTVGYCRLFMFVKGFLIGLSTGGIVTGIGWVLAFEIRSRVTGKTRLDPHAIAELTSGGFAGLSLVIADWMVSIWVRAFM